VRAALTETARAAFGDGPDATGIVRIQASRGGDGVPRLCVVPRLTGTEPASWRAILAPFPHEGAMPWSGAKVSNHLLFALAGDLARARGVDEAFLADAEGRVIEGSRSNLLRVDEDGSITTPDLARGGVAGVGLEVLRERAPEIRDLDLTKDALLSARELIAINSIRGPRPVLELDGRPIADGRPGPIAARLAALFDAD
jgi:branched-subunit amino acid aminotransferase/4-amino-4-deoxychorismate lyase